MVTEKKRSEAAYFQHNFIDETSWAWAEEDWGKDQNSKRIIYTAAVYFYLSTVKLIAFSILPALTEELIVEITTIENTSVESYPLSSSIQDSGNTQNSTPKQSCLRLFVSWTEQETNV